MLSRTVTTAAAPAGSKAETWPVAVSARAAPVPASMRNSLV